MAQPGKLSEKDLHNFWKSSRYLLQPLESFEHLRIEVIYRGKYNADSGPDFRDATIRMGNQLKHGDVEIHLDAKDWFSHGHNHDPAYNQVILHVSLNRLPPPGKILAENGCAIPQLILPQEVLFKSGLVESASMARLPVLDCPLQGQPQSKRIATIQKAGLIRFDQKTACFREQLERVSWDQLLYQGVCEALGYAKNQHPFRKLSERVPIDLLFTEIRDAATPDAEMRVSALLFGAAGLLKAPEREGMVDAEVRQYLAPRQTVWRALRHILQIRPLAETEWQFFRLRPLNFPTRRLAAVGQLVLKFYQTGMLEALVNCIDQKTARITELAKELRNFFVVPAGDFWQNHCDFRSRVSGTSRVHYGHLIGEQRADDLVVNVILPILAAYGLETRHSALQNRIREVYTAYPSLQENILTKKMRRQLFPEFTRKTKRDLTGARFQQGLIHLCKTYCRPLNCEACLGLTPPAAKSEREN